MSAYEIYLNDEGFSLSNLLRKLCGSGSAVDGGYSFEVGDGLGLVCQNLEAIKGSLPLTRRDEARVKLDTIIRLNMYSATPDNYKKSNVILSDLIRANRDDFIFAHDLAPLINRNSITETNQ